jgi:hypothetical protein
MRLWWRLRRRPTPEPLALGKPVEFIGTRSDGRPVRFVPTEFVWDGEISRLVFQDERSYLARRRIP